MRKLVKNLLFFGFSFGVVAYFIPGFKFESTQTLLMASFIFALLSLLIKPILVTFLAPLNFLALGSITPLINLLLIFSLTFFIPNFRVEGFQFSGFTYQDFSLPSYWINTFLTLVLASLASSFIYSLLDWFFD